MARYSLGGLFIALCAAAVCAGEPKRLIRPITEADSVLAVYLEDLGESGGTGTPSIILAAWPDSHMVWSRDRFRGGAPYRAGQVNPQKFAKLLARFEKDGLFADEKLNQARFGPDSEFISVLVKSGKKQVNMRSWHELFEESDKLVVTHSGAEALDGRRRLDVLRKEPADYLFYRFVWSETRGKLADLIPGESTVSTGKPCMKAGVLSWQDASSKVQQPRRGKSSKK